MDKTSEHNTVIFCLFEYTIRTEMTEVQVQGVDGGSDPEGHKIMKAETEFFNCS